MEIRKALEARSSASNRLAREHPQAGRARIALISFGLFGAFYGLFALYVHGTIPAWLFACVGIPVFIRFFDATHEEIHVRQYDSVLWRLPRQVFSISGPLQLGYAQLARNHWAHHAFQGTSRDPDLWLENGNLLTSFLHSMTQPEQAVVRYLLDYGADRRFVFDVSLNLSVWVGFAWVCTPAQFLVYNAVARFGNGVSWWVFTHVLHRQGAYRSFDPIRLPAALRIAWIVLIGRNNLNAITYHYLHHAHAHVPSLELPALSRELADAAASATERAQAA
jgi:hypothetical protein